MTWTAPHGLEVLFSPAHGFVFWTPLAVLASPGWSGWRCDRRVSGATSARLALLMVALQVYVGGSVESWTVAGAFGQRRFVALTVLLGDRPRGTVGRRARDRRGGRCSRSRSRCASGGTSR